MLVETLNPAQSGGKIYSLEYSCVFECVCSLSCCKAMQDELLSVVDGTNIVVVVAVVDVIDVQLVYQVPAASNRVCHITL